jgi:hypothetical protein
MIATACVVSVSWWFKLWPTGDQVGQVQRLTWQRAGEQGCRARRDERPDKPANNGRSPVFRACLSCENIEIFVRVEKPAASSGGGEKY